MASLVEVCVALVSALCVALLVYGAWLCLPIAKRKSPEESRGENVGAAAVQASSARRALL